MSKYYLRGGDFRPEQLTEANKAGFCTLEDACKALAAANNLFNSQEEAAEAYNRVRQTLSSLRLEKKLISGRFDHRLPMPGFEYLTIGRVQKILTDLQKLADAYGYSTSDRDKVCDLIGKVLVAWDMEFRLRSSKYLRENDKQDTPSPNPIH